MVVMAAAGRSASGWCQSRPWWWGFLRDLPVPSPRRPRRFFSGLIPRMDPRRSGSPTFSRLDMDPPGFPLLVEPTRVTSRWAMTSSTALTSAPPQTRRSTAPRPACVGSRPPCTAPAATSSSISSGITTVSATRATPALLPRAATRDSCSPLRECPMGISMVGSRPAISTAGSPASSTSSTRRICSTSATRSPPEIRSTFPRARSATSRRHRMPGFIPTAISGARRSTTPRLARTRPSTTSTRPTPRLAMRWPKTRRGC